jgi:hypothetical protein
LVDEEPLGQILREVAPIAEPLTKEPLGQSGHGMAIIYVARRQTEGQQFDTVVDDQMELEAVEPADRRLAASSYSRKDPMAADARILADGEGGRIDEADPRAGPELGLQEGDQRNEVRRHQLDEALITDQVRKLCAQEDLDVVRVVPREVTEMRLMEVNEQSQDLAGMQVSRATAVFGAAGQQGVFPLRAELLPEIIDQAKELEYCHSIIENTTMRDRSDLGLTAEAPLLR